MDKLQQNALFLYIESQEAKFNSLCKSHNGVFSKYSRHVFSYKITVCGASFEGVMFISPINFEIVSRTIVVCTGTD